MSLGYVPHPDPETVLADCEQRALEREGIPMVLALEDLTGGLPPVRDASALAEGPELARLLGHYGERLRPGAADDDLKALASVLTVLARAHFDEGSKA
ncbi:hypothetical protein [Thermoactinospora rubra]|uniref:hypothetical protein n=1 Tax=Thermoactinospora rubra TaxID=1088767 RepID=UPI000A10D78A|nr:hypothetical protein [Thermoactinospora rubra]